MQLLELQKNYKILVVKDIYKYLQSREHPMGWKRLSKNITIEFIS